MNSKDELNTQEIIALFILLAVLVSPTLFLEQIFEFIGGLIRIIIGLGIICLVVIVGIYILDNSQKFGIIEFVGEFSDVILKFLVAGIIIFLPLILGWILSNFGIIALETLGFSNATETISFLTLSPLYFLATYGIFAFIAIIWYKHGDNSFR